MNDEKTKVSVNKVTKREIDIIAASEQRPVYVVVEEMVSLYKSAKTGRKGPVDVSEIVNYRAVKTSKLPRPNRKAQSIPVVEIVPA
jgi:hypothetical protein